jgi:PAS domain S-box-containing protein
MLGSLGDGEMEQTTGRILERSSDAIVIVRLADGAVLGINEAFFAVTGHPERELTGRHVRDLFVDLRSEVHRAGGEEGLGGVTEALIGLWTRSGELRCGHLSALVVDMGGHREAVCVIRDVRDPTPTQRRLAARERFTRIVDTSGPPLEVATSAIGALGESLRWEFGALWLKTPESDALGCAAVWRSPLADLGALEEASWRSPAWFGVGLVGRAWRQRRAAWISDAAKEPDPHGRLDEVGDLVHGWFSFPIWVGGDVVGIVEFFSCEVREPDEELLQMMEQLGGLLGRLLESAEGPTEHSNGTVADGLAGAAPPVQPLHESLWSALRDLEETVAAIAAPRELPDAMAEQASPELLQGLAASIGKLDRLLEDAVEARQQRQPATQASAVAAPSTVSPPPKVPTGLTLKAVSRRTGIPAATLRTWERRYHFLRPERSASGYRLYGEVEIARILQVKYLMEEGVRIGEAMATVRGSLHRPQATG